MGKQDSTERLGLKGGLLALSLLSCPCHLIFVISLLSGTLFGTLLSEHYLGAAALLLLIFVYSSMAAMRHWDRRIPTDRCGDDLPPRL